MRASAYKFSQKVLGEAGVRVAATLFVLLLARKLGPEIFGHYSSAMAYAALCIVFVDMGTNAILTREIARRKEARVTIAQSSHLLKLCASIVAMGLLWTLTTILQFTPEARFITLALGIVVTGQTLTDYFASLLTGIEEMGWEAVLKTLARVLTIAFALIPLWRGRPLATIVSWMATGAFVGYAASLFILRHRFGLFGLQADLGFVKDLLQSSWPLFISTAFWILYESQDILILNFFKQPAEHIGHFSAAIKIIDVLRVYPVLFLGVFFPTLSRLHTTDAAAFTEKRQRLFRFLSLSLAAISIGLYFTSPVLIPLLYRTGYEPAIALLQVLAVALALSGINYGLAQFLISQNRERSLLKGALIASGANLLLAAGLVPHFGPLGTCYAMIGSEACYHIYLRRATHA